MAELPTGEVTLLFTDVEDSTGLLQRLGDGYRKAMADHRQLVRDAVKDNEGQEVDARADEFCLVFTEAGKAVEAAASTQLAHVEHSWPGEVPLKVRMGLHTGSRRSRRATTWAWTSTAPRASARSVTAARCSCPGRPGTGSSAPSTLS